MFNKNKTKWVMIYSYNPVATNSMNIVFARYDNKTGLYDFKTKTVCRDLYSNSLFNIPIDAANELVKLRKDTNQ